MATKRGGNFEMKEEFGLHQQSGVGLIAGEDGGVKVFHNNSDSNSAAHHAERLFGKIDTITMMKNHPPSKVGASKERTENEKNLMLEKHKQLLSHNHQRLTESAVSDVKPRQQQQYPKKSSVNPINNRSSVVDQEQPNKPISEIAPQQQRPMATDNKKGTNNNHNVLFRRRSRSSSTGRAAESLSGGGAADTSKMIIPSSNHQRRSTGGGGGHNNTTRFGGGGGNGRVLSDITTDAESTTDAGGAITYGSNNLSDYQRGDSGGGGGGPNHFDNKVDRHRRDCNNKERLNYQEKMKNATNYKSSNNNSSSKQQQKDNSGSGDSGNADQKKPPSKEKTSHLPTVNIHHDQDSPAAPIKATNTDHHKQRNNGEERKSGKRRRHDPEKSAGVRNPIIRLLVQQKFHTFQPLFMFSWGIPAYFTMALICFGSGAIMKYLDRKWEDFTYDYTKCWRIDSVQGDGQKCHDLNYAELKAGCVCRLKFKLEEAVDGNVEFFYGLTNFYQNTEAYFKSRFASAFRGDEHSILNPHPKCQPYIRTPEKKPIYPCGSIANSFFNDTFKLYYYPSESEAKEVPLERIKGIARDADLNTLFRNPKNKSVFQDCAKPPDWPYELYQRIFLNPPNWNHYGNQYEPLIVWMIPSPLSSFRKRYGLLKRDKSPFKQGLPAGQYVLRVEYNYPVKPIHVVKTFSIVRAGPFQVIHGFLPLAFLILGSIIMIICANFVCLQMLLNKHNKHLVNDETDASEMTMTHSGAHAIPEYHLKSTTSSGGNW